MKKKFLLTLLVLLSISISLFAMGAKEVGANEKAVTVISNTAIDGGSELLVKDTDGVQIIYRTNADTVSAFPTSWIESGDVLIIKDNGMMTMSLPGQTTATEIRNVTVAQNMGIYNFTFGETESYPAATEETPVEVVEVAVEEKAPETLQEKFSYGYGYDLITSYKAQGLTVNAGYFARGILDFYNLEESTLLLPTSEMVDRINNYFENVLGTVTDYDPGKEPASLDEVRALPATEDDTELFSYAYGFYLAYQHYYGGVDFAPEFFVEGSLDAIFGNEPLLTQEERSAAMDEYVAQIQAEYDAYIAELKTTNKAAADAFLADNAKAEGVVTTDSGLQYIVNVEGDGATPAAEDTVTVNYTLRDLNGNVLDQGTDAQFVANMTVPGFEEALLTMKVGSSITAYVPPELGYGENGTSNIAPNSLLIFDIELTGVTKAE